MSKSLDSSFRRIPTPPPKVRVKVRVRWTYPLSLVLQPPLSDTNINCESRLTSRPTLICAMRSALSCFFFFRLPRRESGLTKSSSKVAPLLPRTDGSNFFFNCNSLIFAKSSSVKMRSDARERARSRRSTLPTVSYIL